MKDRRKSVLSPCSHAGSSKKKVKTETKCKIENGTKPVKRVTFDLEEKPPVKMKQESPEKVCPPPEYVALNYNECCPKVNELLCLDTPTQIIPQVEMIRLQHDLELLLAFSTSAHNRAVGEVAFLTSGDYPTVDLTGRPSATFFNRFIPEIDDNTYTLDNLEMAKMSAASEIPGDEFAADSSGWPPVHLPTKFWKWCMDNFLTPLDTDFIREYKTLFVDEVVPAAIEKLYINEPWKNRKREKPRGRGSNPPKRKNGPGSPDYQPPQKRPPTRDRIYDSIANMLSVVCKEIKMNIPSEQPLPILEKRVNRIFKKPLFGTDAQSILTGGLLEAAELQEELLLNPPPPEPEEEENVPVVENGCETPYKSGLRSPRMTSPRIKIETVDDEGQEPILNGHAAVNGNGIHINGKTTPVMKKRRNSDRKDDETTPKMEKTYREVEIKHEPEENGVMMNGTHDTRSKRNGRRPSFSNGSAEKKKNGVKETEENGHEEAMEEGEDPEMKMINSLVICKLNEMKKEIEETRKEEPDWEGETIEDLRKRNIKVEVVGMEGYGNKEAFVSKEELLSHFSGELILNNLVVNNILPQIVLSIFTFFLGHDLNVDYLEDGREDDDEELDEVSMELMRTQKELKELEPEVRGAVLHCWFRLQEDFAFWETLRQLDEADRALFRLVDNTYNEFPRRFPKPNEWSSLMTAYSRHIDKSKLHYGQKFKRHPVLRINTARRVADPHLVEELL